MADDTDPTLTIRLPGTPASLSGVPVVVTSVLIARGGVAYEVAWVHEGARYEQYVEEFELDFEPSDMELGNARGTGGVLRVPGFREA